MRERTACFSGHRTLPKNKCIHENLRTVLIRLIEEKGVMIFCNGGAIGFDFLAATTVIELKKEYPNIKLVMILPCKNQNRKWSEDNRRQYEYILSNADKIEYISDDYYEKCMLDRNRRMVEISSHCIAYLTNKRSGTAYTVKYAKQCGLSINNIAAE